MAHTNSTPHYALPQFITSDKPAWLTDVNNAYVAIDTGIHNAKTAADNAQEDATQAIGDASTATTKANGADGKASGALASISEAFIDSSTYDVGDLVLYNNLLYICHTAVTVPGDWTGATNWSRTDIDTQLVRKLNDLKDVSISSPAENDILSLDENGEWVNKEPNTFYKTVWSGAAYQTNDTMQIADFNINKTYIVQFYTFSSIYTDCHLILGGQQNIQFVVRGDSSQFARYRLSISNTGLVTISNESSGTAINTAIVRIYEMPIFPVI